MTTAVDGSGKQKLVAEGIRVHFEGVRAVDGVDLTLEQGEIMGLIGPNGLPSRASSARSRTSPPFPP